MDSILPQHTQELYKNLKIIINEARVKAGRAVNAQMTQLYWHVGKRIQAEVLKFERAEYGKEVIKSVSKQLTSSFGRGWSTQQLHHCVRFAASFPDKEIVYTLCIQLNWSQLRIISFMEDPLKREFYIEMAKLEGWSVRQLQDRIKSMLYERTAISKKPEETIRKDLNMLRKNQTVSPDLIFRDPYVLDFLGLHDSYSEKDLESAILAELQRFISELGTDFAFLARQKRITVDHRDYYIDLLFFHRRLKCLVAIDLKLGEFEAAYKGQMELYLRYLEKYEQVEGEQTPIGLILCTGKNEEHIELLRLDESNIRVADYMTHLPPRELFKEKLHQAMVLARKRLEQLGDS